MYDRKLLVKLSLCAWKVLSEYLKQGVAVDKPIPGCVIAVQTFEEFLNFNPHLHIIATDGCFYGDSKFMRSLVPKAEDLEIPFAIEVFYMLEKEGKINNVIIDNMMNWQHSGFNIYCELPVSPMDEEGVERLSQYIIRVPISQERIMYIPENASENGVARVVYEGKKTSGTDEIFSALDWLARLVTHIPNKSEQVVRYYGYYSNKSQGMWEKDNEEDKNAPDLVESDISLKAFRKNWARLIQKIYHVDALLCPKCGKHMKIAAFIKDLQTIKKN